MGPVVVEGLGLHAGVRARVSLSAADDPRRATTFNGAALAEWRAVKAERATAIVRGTVRARTVEHLFAAAAGLGLRRGLAIALDGGESDRAASGVEYETPIVDGSAAAWTDALAPLEIAASPPTIAVVRDEVIDVGTSRYTFARDAAIGVGVEIELGDPRVARDAAWDGDAADFRTRIAPARTFCFAHEVEALAQAGLASHVTPQMVVVLGPEILAAGRPFEADEPARHKLLDLVGDLFLYGGPPRGRVHAYRPGHWSTHAAMRLALERGVVAPV